MWRPPLPDWQASIDMRSAAECELAPGTDGALGGYGIFVYPAAVTGPGITTLTDDPNGIVGATEIAVLEAAFQTTLLRPKLSDILIDLHLEMDNIDVTGATKRRPIMPTDRNMAELHLGGLIRQDETGPTDVYWPVVEAQYQYDFAQRRAYDEPRGLVAHRKMLGAWMRQWKVDDPSMFQPPGGVIVEPLDPDTTVTDSFDRANDTNLNASSTGKSPNFTWNETTAAWRIASNQLAGDAGGFVWTYARADYDLSSSNNYAQFTLGFITSPGATVPQAVARLAAGAENGYTLAANGFTPVYASHKLAAGTPTQIGSNGSATLPTAGHVMKCECNGSTITSYRNGGVDVAATTDTTYSSGLRGGIGTFAAGDNFYNDFEMADLGGAPPPSFTGARYRAPGLLVYGGSAG
jgi:hypothetical protein